MSTLSRHHKKLNEQGEGRCSVPMWLNGCPGGFCDKPAYGERPHAPAITRWDGYVYREDGLYPGYVPALACPGHGGPKARAFMDGDSWCAVHPDFQNLQESAAGFGATREAAIEALRLAHQSTAEQP